MKSMYSTIADQQVLGINSPINASSQKERELYETLIAALRAEVSFLRKLLEEKTVDQGA